MREGDKVGFTEPQADSTSDDKEYSGPYSEGY